MAGPYYDKKEQIEKIRAGLLAGERIDGVFDLTTGQGALEFEFRGADKAHFAFNLILHHMMGVPLAPAQTVICPRCHTGSPESIVFCPSCGTQRTPSRAAA